MAWSMDETVSANLRCGCALCGPGSAAVGSTAGAAGALTPSRDTAYYIAALLPGGEPRWSSDGSPGGTVGTASSVTYSFLSSSPTYAGADDRSGFAAANDSQKSAFRQAFALWATVCNLTFTEVTDSASSRIRIGTNNQGNVSSGYAYYPALTSGGDIYLANDMSGMDNPTYGSWMFSTVTHEIGHAIGLKHPGDYNAGGGGTEGPYLPSGEDNRQYSVMSYNDNPTMSGLRSSMPSLYDIAAVQYLYGANTGYAAGDSTYSYSDSSSFLATIWDGGGTDTIDASNQSLACTISLTAGSFSSIGVGTSTSAAGNNVGIAFNVTIENAVGGSAGDIISGNSAANRLEGGAGDDTLTGGAGDDTLIGGAGTDVAVFSGARSAYQVTTTADGATTVLHLSSGSDGTDTLSGVETLRFSDQDVTVARTVTSTTVTPRFSAAAYAALNSDLFSAFGTDTASLTRHYVNNGRSEGRSASGFDPYAYAALNSDLFAAFGTDVTSLTRHYVNSGRSEGRSATGFNVQGYAAANSDLFSAFGTDTTSLVRHYVNSGRGEGRDPGSITTTTTTTVAAGPAYNAFSGGTLSSL